MSRIGKKPIAIPKGVQVAVKGQQVDVQGPKGKLGLTVHDLCSVRVADGSIVVDRSADHRSAKALHGLTRALVANMVRGVTEGFEKKLEIVGIGYRVQASGRTLTFSLGYSHPIVFPLPDGIQADVDKQTLITLRGADKQLVGQMAAQIRGLRRPDPYKAKGIRYADEVVRRKVGKAGAK
ncbi:MAG: 50S ribosomal protein L6 [Candidatus Rokubacteria bacterium]|nr:50S ribosomal protein L6 [Candidatus Rokubacteria bacterium]